MDSLRKQEIVEGLKELMPFIQAESVGQATQKRILDLLSGAAGNGLVEWFNQERPARQSTPISELLGEVIRLISRLRSRCSILTANQFSDRAEVVAEAKTQLPLKLELLEALLPKAEERVFLTTANLTKHFVNKRGEAISRRQLQELLRKALGDGDKRQIGQKKVWQFEVNAAKRYMATTTWKYQAAD